MEDQKKKQLQLMKLIYGHILVFISIIIIVIQLLMIFSRICRDSPTSGSHFLIVLQHQANSYILFFSLDIKDKGSICNFYSLSLSLSSLYNFHDKNQRNGS
ncbi:hypothetical protein V6Z11_A09G216300 [Gossypium hirsutum]